ncbi:hypothetical protein H5410_062108 [Solanum commersonii]|uniref:Uncharacterized protein n=1 Tax=Solanum commersonii TaxID=4109 RepID=A0A9J5WBM4_SOLCO|nr:hypothetical protein H5410_062108 [Solanum commersonii]
MFKPWLWSILHMVSEHETFNPEPTACNRPSRSHKLPTYLHDYVLPKTMPKQFQHSNISLNTAFSKHQHVPPEALALESQTLVRNLYPWMFKPWLWSILHSAEKKVPFI